METFTRKIGSNRGTPRLWLEGSLLLSCGFYNGLRFNYELTGDNGFTLTLHHEGKSKVAGTVGRPIIDINSAKKLALFTVGQSVQVTTGKIAGSIHVHA